MHLKELNHRLSRQTMPARILLSKLCYADGDTLTGHEYLDNRNLPVYFHLGRMVSAKRILNLGLSLGFTLGAYLYGAKGVELVAGVQEPDSTYYSTRLAKHNLRNVYHGKMELYHSLVPEHLFRQHWDLVIIDGVRSIERQSYLMSEAWECTEGLMCVDRSRENSRAIEDFSMGHKLLPECVKTRHGLAIFSRHPQQQSQNSAIHSTMQESDLTSAKSTKPFLTGTAPRVVTSAPQT